MLEHEQIRELISLYFDNETNPQEKDVVEEHILGCESCKQYYQQLSKLHHSLLSVPDQDLSPDLEQKINRQLSTLRHREEEKMKKTLVRPAFVTVSTFVVVLCASLFASQLYIKRGIQGRLRSASDYIGEQATYRSTVRRDIAHTAPLIEQSRSEIAITGRKRITDASERQAAKKQYEPYFLDSGYSVASKESLRVAAVAPTDKFDSKVVLLGQAIVPIEKEDREGFAPWQYQQDGDWNTEQYNNIVENEFLSVSENPLSTFSIDVDTASYANIRRFLNEGRLPPPDAVRIEEMINYFTYDYPQPTGEDPFSVTLEAGTCPWNPKHDLLLVGLQGKSLKKEELRPSNLVFLIDVSGSMNQANKLPLLKTAFRLFVNQLSGNEKVAIVSYAGAAGLVLPPTDGTDKTTILNAIDRMNAGGSTAGGQGIQLAYKIAKENFIPGGNNRVILATDGDFNVGVSSDGDLVRIIEEKRREGIFLTVLGFGTGNYKDSKMEQLADKGNGNYYYIDTQREAQKVLVSELGSVLFTIAKDVKLQLEFNPAQVKAYRLIGYENRLLAKEDFNDDTKDAGELGAGHTVTALYEIVPAGSDEQFGNVDALKYQATTVAKNDELMTVKLRYKAPDEDTSKLITKAIKSSDIRQANVSDNLKFSSAVAEFGLLLRSSKHKGNANYTQVLTRAKEALGQDPWGYRAEFIQLVEKASALGQPGEIRFKGSTP